MIIIIHGADTFRSHMKKREALDVFRRENNGQVLETKFDAETSGFNEIKSVLETPSLFHDPRLITVEHSAANSLFHEELAGYKNLKQISRDPKILFLIVGEKSVGPAIARGAHAVYEFKVLTQAEAGSWFADFFGSRKAVLKRPLIQEVVRRCAQEGAREFNADAMWRAYNEIQKILTFRGDTTITVNDLDILDVGVQGAYIFPTLDAIFSGDTPRAFHRLQLHWQGGEPPQVVFSMIERQLKTTALIQSTYESKRQPAPSIAKALSLHPYVVEKTIRVLPRFSRERIADLYSRAESLDIKSKSGAINPQLACELLAAAISR